MSPALVLMAEEFYLLAWKAFLGGVPEVRP